jgi:GDP-4-dehydro-6-deoxy-D-mannose reductase
MTRRILVTGASGFLGRHLCEHISHVDASVELIRTDIVDGANTGGGAFYPVGLTDESAVSRLIERTKPECIFHLAGLFSANDNSQLYKSNVLSAATLLEAVRIYKSDAVVIVTGSAAEYGLIKPDQLPVDETTPCRPVTAYGLSKQLATETALYYHRVHGLCTMVARPFQLVGKGVTSRLAPGAFAEQLKRCASEGMKVIKVGNLDSSRDFLDVRDAAEALWLISQKPAPGQIFNLCSGQPVKMKDLLNLMIEISGARVEVETDTSRLRGRFDVPDIHGSFDKIFKHCGWRPHTTLLNSIRAMFE